MAKRKKKRKGLEQDLEWTLQSHFRQLGCRHVDDYFVWCNRHGFRADTRKSTVRLRRELAFHRKRMASDRLRQAHSNRDPAAVIDRVCAGELTVEQIPVSHLRDVCGRIAQASLSLHERQWLREFLAFIAKKTDLLTQHEIWGDRTIHYLDGLIAVHALREQWIRPFREWCPRSHNRYRQFSSLVRYLLAKYDVPAFFDSTWFRTDEVAGVYRDWFVRIGRGINPRHGPTPVPMTKRIAHHFLSAPDNYTVEQAIRWGQIRALGGDARLCTAVIETQLGKTLDNDEFWQDVLRFFIRNPMLDLAQVGPIVDFLQNQKFESQQVFIGDGPAQTLPPPQPNLSMRGRTPHSLLIQVDAWHQRLGKIQGDDSVRWTPIGFEGMTLVSGKKERRNVWRITELRSHKELVCEGQAMRHCVATYAASCKNHHVSIWSMTLEDAGGSVQRCQTVEVDRHRAIVQSRGRLNRLATEQERRVLARWAQESSLRLVMRL